MKAIRNFALIAHIDHGKSTLADRIIETCGQKVETPQVLDSLELEREHGITIKLKAIRLNYNLGTKTLSPQQKARTASSAYNLNLIDTPGHVDFTYEVSRSLASVEGAILIVDATSGVQAQTLANFNLALDANLVIIPVINKIDSSLAEIEKTTGQLEDLGFDGNEIIKVSAKTGENVEKLLGEIIHKIPAPKAKSHKPQALIFDSSFDPYKGVVATIRVFGGKIKVGEKISLAATGVVGEVLQIGYLVPKLKYVDQISTGEVGFVVTNLKDLGSVKVGDTIVDPKDPSPALPGYRKVKPVVYLSLYPTEAKDFLKLKEALARLKLNDAALTVNTEPTTSLGQGFRIGFLGLLHAQITQERLEREYNLDVITTSPSVDFEIDGRKINKPSEFDPTAKCIKEPHAKVIIFTPEKFYGSVANLIHEKRGKLAKFENVGNLLIIEADIPILELVIGFYDQLKSLTSGFASFDFEVSDYRAANLVKLDILVNYKPVEGLSQIVALEKAEMVSRKLVEKLKETIPKQQIAIPIQAVVGNKIIARETIPSYRKDVTAKLYGGDVTRKMKLLEKQKKGKKRMRRFGNVEIPQEAFLAVLKI